MRTYLQFSTQKKVENTKRYFVFLSLFEICKPWQIMLGFATRFHLCMFVDMSRTFLQHHPFFITTFLTLIDVRKKRSFEQAPSRKKILYHLPFFHFKCEFHLLFKFNLHRVGGPSSIEHRKANCTLFKIYFGGAHHSINGNNFFKDVIFWNYGSSSLIKT